MNIKPYKWILMPVCLVLGLVMLFAFVKASQSYLSGYLNENSKEFVGKGIELKTLSEHLQDERITLFSTTHPDPSYVLVFWSLTCSPCLKDLAQLRNEQGNSLIIPINTDPKESLEQAHKTFSSLVESDLPFLHDANSLLQTQLKVKYLPTHIYIDKAGFITKHQVGAKPF